MATRPDILLFDREGRRLLVAEVKNKRNTTPKWAAELRRNLLAHEGFRHAEFFLVLTPDHLYLWRGMTAEPVAPDYVVDSHPLFLPYLQRAGLDLDRISSPVFELMAISWLSDLVHSRREPETVGHDDGRTWLVQSGLLEAVRNGRLAYELAA